MVLDGSKPAHGPDHDCFPGYMQYIAHPSPGLFLIAVKEPFKLKAKRYEREFGLVLDP